MPQINYIEDKDWNQFAITNADCIDLTSCPKNIEMNVSNSEYTHLLKAPIEEVKDKIKKILEANYPINK